MKLVYFHNTPLKSDAANLTQVINMCKALISKGIEVTLSIPDSGLSHSETQNILNKRYHVNDLNIEYMPHFSGNRRINKYTYHLRIKGIIKKIKPDLCYVRYPLFLSACLNQKIPTFFESHNSRTHEESDLINRYLNKILIRSAHNPYLVKIITISEALAKHWVQMGIEESRIMSLHDGFDSELFNEQIGIDEAKRKLNINPDQKVVMYTGSMNPSRGMDQIIYLAQELKDVKVIVIGGPERYRQHYENEARELGLSNIDFIGFVDHSKIPEYLYAADVLLALWTSAVKTINYCSPLKVFEYMAAGRNIVISAFPTIKEVLKDKKHAIFSEPDDKQDLLVKTKEALTLNGRPSELAQDARKLAFEKYSWEKRVNEILSLYEMHG